MVRRTLIILVMFSTLLSYCHNQAQAQTVTIPFQLRVNLIVLKITINGISKSFILDTGASSTVIDSKTADELGLAKIGKGEAVVAGTQIPVSIVQVDSIGIDSVVLHDFLCGAANIRNIKALLGEDISGVLGFDFLSKFKITIDYLAKRLIFDLYQGIPGDTIAVIGDTCWIPKFGKVIKPELSWEFSTDTPQRQIRLILYNTQVTGTVQIQDHELQGIPLKSAIPFIEQSLRTQIEGYETIKDTTSELEGREIYVLEYEGREEGTNLRFKHIFIKVKDNLFSITCYAPTSLFALLEQDFEKIIHSIQFAE